MAGKIKLSILVPMYNETADIIKPLLDSIAIQQNINFREIEVVIVVDGGTTMLTQEFINNYPFPILFLVEKHRGVSATRNCCLDNARGEYVMFCDCDDMFYNACGLYILFLQMEQGFDTLVSQFIEETRDSSLNNIPVYINHDMDSTFVHGKVHNRQYLIDNKIRWDESLTIHEDSYFNILCQHLTEKGVYCPTPFYLWKWRDDSVCRHDPLYINKTYVNFIDSSTALAKQFIKRKKIDDAKFFVTSMVYDAYYSFNCDKWWSEDGHEFLEATERRFKKYYNEFKKYILPITSEVTQQIIVGVKNRFFSEGLLLERITFDDWIKHIKNL